ncbi:putative nucleic acid-binding protein [Helianthus anomalus]
MERQIEQANVTLLNDLNVMMDNVTLKVRIIRLWTRPLFNSTKGFYSKEMIIMDEAGNKVQCNVLYKNYGNFSHLLHENQCIFIDNPTFDENKAKYKYVINAHKVSLNQNTTIRRCNNFAGSRYGFSFAAFQAVLERTIDLTHTIDIIGMIDGIHKMVVETLANGKLSKRINLKLQDLNGHYLDVTLWDAYAEQMATFQAKNADRAGVVIILQFAKVKMMGVSICCCIFIFTIGYDL